MYAVQHRKQCITNENVIEHVNIPSSNLNICKYPVKAHMVENSKQKNASSQSEGVSFVYQLLNKQLCV